MKNLTNIFILIASLALFSCGSKKDDGVKDNVKPTVSIISPTVDLVVDASSNLNFKAEVADNQALSSYTLTIDYDTELVVKSTYDFKFDSAVNKTDAEGKALPIIEGKSSVIDFNISLKDSSSKVAKDGQYLLVFEVQDKSGNSTKKVFKFKIKQ